MKLEKLKDPILLQWKFQNKMGTDKCVCVAYIDARDVMNRLDEVCSPENWQSEFYSHAGKLFCKIGIRIGDHIVWKSDAGMDTKVEADKGAASSAFKRAANMWGIGRFAYEVDSVLMTMTEYKNKPYATDNDNNMLWTSNKLSEYINNNYDSLKKIN